MLEMLMNLFGIKTEKQLTTEKKKHSKCTPRLRYFYARDGKKNERVLSVARKVDFDNGRIIYAWTINDPRVDRFVRREARRILQDRLKDAPGVVVLTDGKGPIKTVVEALMSDEKFPASGKKLLERWSKGSS